MQIIGHFPLLNPWGSTGAGKTCTCTEIIAPFSGLKMNEPYSVTSTEFSLVKLLSSTNGLPLVFDEYKPYDIPPNKLKRLHRFLRRIYDGEVETRGLPDQTLRSYVLTAPVILAGECTPTESALLERIIPVFLSPEYIQENPKHEQNFNKLRSLNLFGFMDRYIQFILNIEDTTLEDLLDRSKKIAESMIHRKVPFRVLDNLTVICLGLLLFEDYGVQWNLKPSIKFEDHIEESLNCIVEDIYGAGTTIKLAVDYFLEQLSVMARTDRLKRGMHYTLNPSGNLCIHFPSCFADFKKFARETNFDGEILNKKAYLRQFAERNYIVKDKDGKAEKHTWFGGKTMWAIEIDVNKANLDLSGFENGIQ